MRLDQRSRLQLFLFKKQHEFGSQLICNTEYFLTIKSRVDPLWRSQDRGVVVGSKPLFSDLDQGRLSPDENALLFNGQFRVKPVGDGEVDASRRTFGSASLDQDCDEKKTGECESCGNATSSFHKKEL